MTSEPFTYSKGEIITINEFRALGVLFSKDYFFHGTALSYQYQTLKGLNLADRTNEYNLNGKNCNYLSGQLPSPLYQSGMPHMAQPLLKWLYLINICLKTQKETSIKKRLPKIYNHLQKM